MEDTQVVVKLMHLFMSLQRPTAETSNLFLNGNIRPLRTSGVHVGTTEDSAVLMIGTSPQWCGSWRGCGGYLSIVM